MLECSGEKTKVNLVTLWGVILPTFERQNVRRSACWMNAGGFQAAETIDSLIQQHQKDQLGTRLLCNELEHLPLSHLQASNLS